MGSIFYSNMSSLNGDFNREEFVNGGANYYTQYPNENTSEGNKNPSICWIKQFGNPIESYAQYCIAATWERFNASNNKLQIFGAIKVDECNPITAFKRYGSDPDNQNSYTGILREFNASSNFGSKPEIISAFYHTDGVDLNDPYDYFYIVPHLEPASSGNKLVITAKYHDLQGFDGINYIWNDNNFIIENQDVYEFSVEGTQFHWDNNNQFGYFNLHLAYQKGNDIIYRMEQIKFENGSNYIERTFIPPNNYQVTLSEPGEIERISPDISLKNNKPIVTYRGKKYIQHWIQYPNGGEELFSSYSYPIHIKYKLDDNNWGILWSYSSPNEQISPDVEGSRDAGAYIINFTVKNSGVFNKYVKIDNQYGYICTPQAYSGQDSKIMKGSYTGTSIEKNVKRKYYSTNES
jgi:hypothetical protein